MRPGRGGGPGAVVHTARCRGGPTTGLQRTGRALLHALRDRGVTWPTWAPTWVDDALVDRHLPGVGDGRLGRALWEQVSLPLAARGTPVLSLTNTAPLRADRSVVMVHDLAPLVDPGWFTPSMRAYGALVLAAARRAEMVLTVSQVVAEELAARGIPASRTAVVTPAVDPVFSPAPPAAVAGVRDRLGLHRPYLVLTGWADPRKDAATAVAAHRRVVGARPHDLVLVGRRHDTFRPVVLPHLPSVRRPGYLADDDLVALLSGADGVVYPSRYEGFGLPPLEAWACGTPAVVADIPVLRESTRGLARYVPPGEVAAWVDALGDLLDGEVPVPSLPPHRWDDAAGQLLAAMASVL